MMKKFESTVYNILEKTVDKGVDVNIDLSIIDVLRTTGPGQNGYGEIIETNYWSHENVINIVYMVDLENGERVQRDWRYRPMTGMMFDEDFTLKKVNGVLTFMRRESTQQVDEARLRKSAPAEPLDMRDNGIPIFVVMLQKLLKAGKTVYARSWGNDVALVTDVHYNDHFGTIDVDVDLSKGEGTETDQFGYTRDEADHLKFKNENDVWYITDLDGNIR